MTIRSMAFCRIRARDLELVLEAAPDRGHEDDQGRNRRERAENHPPRVRRAHARPACERSSREALVGQAPSGLLADPAFPSVIDPSRDLRICPEDPASAQNSSPTLDKSARPPPETSTDFRSFRKPRRSLESDMSRTSDYGVTEFVGRQAWLLCRASSAGRRRRDRACAGAGGLTSSALHGRPPCSPLRRVKTSIPARASPASSSARADMYTPCPVPIGMAWSRRRCSPRAALPGCASVVHRAARPVKSEHRGPRKYTGDTQVDRTRRRSRAPCTWSRRGSPWPWVQARSSSVETAAPMRTHRLTGLRSHTR